MVPKREPASTSQRSQPCALALMLCGSSDKLFTKSPSASLWCDVALTLREGPLEEEKINGNQKGWQVSME